MVAEVRAGEVVRGWIWQPQHETAYVAERGAGAYRDGVRLHRPPVGEDLRGVTSRRRWIGRALGALQALELTWVCCGVDYPKLVEGEADYAIYGKGAPWDHAPGSLILAEAGGVRRHLRRRHLPPAASRARRPGRGGRPGDLRPRPGPDRRPAGALTPRRSRRRWNEAPRSTSWAFLPLCDRCNDAKRPGYPVDRVSRPNPRSAALVARSRPKPSGGLRSPGVAGLSGERRARRHPGTVESMEVAAALPGEQPEVEAFLREHQTLRVARRGELVHALDHPAVVARVDGRGGRRGDVRRRRRLVRAAHPARRHPAHPASARASLPRSWTPPDPRAAGGSGW